MIVFNECRIDPERRKLIIEAAVDNFSYYDDITIAAVLMDTQETFVESGPSGKAKPLASYSNKPKKIRLCLDEKELGVSLEDNILFIYVITEGLVAPDTPCGMDNIYTRAIAINLKPIYNTAMKYIRELNSECSIPRGFIDMILRMKAFELSLRTGNFQTAFKQWEKLLKDKTSVSYSKGCRCNGFN